MKQLGQLFLISMFAFLAFACDNSQESKPATMATKKLVEAKGTVVAPEKLKPPKVILRSSLPAPQRIELPKKKGGSWVFTEFNGTTQKIDIAPPVVKPAGLFYGMQNYRTRQGLPSNSTGPLLFDRIGNLWGPSFKYDGKSFTTLPSLGLPVLLDKSGSLWFANSNGAIKYDGATLSDFPLKKKNGENNETLFSMLEDKSGNIWFGTDNGGIKYDSHSFTYYFNTPQNPNADNVHVHYMLEDKSGNIWFSTHDGLHMYDGKLVKTYTTKSGLPAPGILAISEDAAGNIWFPTGKGVSKYDGTSFKTFTTKQGLPDYSWYRSFRDNAGILWIAVPDFFRLDSVTPNNAPIIRYDGKSFSTLSKNEGLPTTEITDIKEDSAGNLWFSSEKGLIKYRGKSLTHFFEKQGFPHNRTASIIEDKSGTLWFAGDKGASKYDGKFFTNFYDGQGLACDPKQILEDKDGNLWFASFDCGLSKYDGKSFTIDTLTHVFKGPARLTSMVFDREGHLWVGSMSGLVRFSESSVTIYTQGQGLASDAVLSLLKDKNGDLWIGNNEGVTKFDGKNFRNFSKTDGISGPDSRITAGLNGPASHIFEEKSGTLWFATKDGPSRFDGKTFQTLAMDQSFGVPAKSGIFGANIAFTTPKALVVLTGYARSSSPNRVIIPAQNNLSNEALIGYTPVFEVFGQSTGYPIDSPLSFYTDSKGIAWIGTGSEESGLVRFDYSALHKGKTPPVFLQGLKIRDRNIIWNNLLDRNEGAATPLQTTEEKFILGKLLTNEERKAMREEFGNITFDSVSKWYPVPQNLVLPYQYNNLTFEFGAIDTNNPETLLYQYTLEGYNDHWSLPSNKTTAVFGNINEGSHTFKVRAKNQFSDWSEPAIYKFEVLPPWHRTWWAYTLFAVFTLSVLYTLYRWRTAALRKHQKSIERFLPQAFLRILKKKKIEDVNLGDSAKVEMTVMFSDIRGFTSLTEKLGPENTALVLNKYMGHMAPIIRQHDGVVGQFLGDGILAFFEIKPEKAIEAVFEMQKALPAFHKDLQEYGIDPIDIGVGLNLGPAVFSMIGEKERLEGHVISDDVNLAARVEGLNKQYKTRFLITGAVYDKIADPTHYIICIVDKVIVKGRTRPVRVYEIFPLPEDPKKLAIARFFVELFNNAFALYEKGNFAKAKELFEECLKQWPGDTAAQLLVKRCEEFLKNGTPDGWDGSTKLMEK